MKSGANKHSFIHGIYVAKPCDQDWGKMTGDERVRFCHSCKLNVYNLSEMTTAEAEELVIEKEGNLCVRFYRRADGTMLTKDCPRGLALARQKALRAVACVSGLVAVAFSWVMSMVPTATREAPVIREVCEMAQQAQQNAKIESIQGGAMVMPEENYIRGKMVMGHSSSKKR